MTVSETIYELGKIRNNKIFGEMVDTTGIRKKIIDILCIEGEIKRNS